VVKRAQAATALDLLAREYDSGVYRRRVSRHRPSFIAHPYAPETATGPNIEERAWAAGFLDAEGYFGLIHSHRRRGGPDWYRIRVSASQHSRDGNVPEVLLRLQGLVDIGRIECHGEADDFKWVAEGRAAILRVLALTETWLGSIKLAQAERALAGFDAQERLKGISSAVCRRGHEYDRVTTSSSGRARRYCNACARLLDRRKRAAEGVPPRQFRNESRRYSE
jgi:hypothetical protein